MAKFRYINQFSFLTLLFSLALSRETGAYYSGHHYQHQPRHLASHRHQMTHRSSQSHFLPPSSSSGRVMPPLPPPPPPPSPKYPNLDRLLHRLDAEAAGKSEALTATSSPSLPPPTSSRRDLLPSFLRPTVPPPLPATPMPSFASPASPSASSHRHRHQQQEDFYDDDIDDEDEDDDEDERDRPGQSLSNGHRDSKVAWDLKFNEEANYQRQQPAGGGVGSGGLSLGGVGTSFSERKWHVLGNRQNLDEFRRRKMPRPSSTESEIREAVQHALKVSREGACKVPRPKVVQVKDVYPHPSKTYIPHCTILHQCGDDTGCCRHETYSCVPKTTHRVELHFYTTTLGRHQGNTVEKLVFYNHTECECLDKMEEMMPRDTGKTTDVGVRHFRHSSNGRTDAFSPSAFRSYRPDRTVVEQPSEQSCRCPSLYSVRYPPNDHGSCSCDCFDKQRECIRAKRGKEYFSLQDRLCIQSEDCLQPSCEFGIYLRRAGRCPRKREKFAAWQRYTLDEYK